MNNSESLAAVHTHTHTHTSTLLKEKNKKRLLYIDILNIIAIMAVIAMHCNGIVHGNPKTRAWNSSLIVECICYFAVPLFFMISGANLMKYRERYTTKEFFKKRFTKVLVPFVFWGILMLVWKVFIVKKLPVKEIDTPIKFLNALFSNKEESTYYFMFEILGIYLAMPLLSLLAKREYQKTLWLTACIFFIFNGTISNILPLFGIKWNSSFTLPLTGYCIYVILGYLLSETEVTKKQRIWIYIGAIIGIIYRYTTTFILSKSAGVVVKTTWGFSSWYNMLLTMAIFIFVKNLKLDEKVTNVKIRTNISKIAGCSFGIYLIHMIVKYYYVTIFNINTTSWHFRTFGIFAIYLISLAIVMILKKMPILKKVVP